MTGVSDGADRACSRRALTWGWPSPDYLPWRLCAALLYCLSFSSYPCSSVVQRYWVRPSETTAIPPLDSSGLIQESPNPYIRDTIITHASLPFEPLGKEFPFYRTPFWDTFSLGHFELRVTPEDERPNCLGGVQMNYPKWVIALAREFGYTNAVEMLYWGVVFTDVVRGKLELTWAGSLESSMNKARRRDFYSLFDYMDLNYAEFSWIYFERDIQQPVDRCDEEEPRDRPGRLRLLEGT